MANWKLVPECPNYVVSDCGQIFNISKKRYLTPQIQKTGYVTITLYNRGEKKRQYLLHRLMMQLFNPNENQLLTVNHKDMNKLNNNLNNLEWMTLSQNCQHAYSNGRRGKQRIFFEDVAKVIKKNPKIKLWELAKIFKCSIHPVWKIRKSILG